MGVPVSAIKNSSKETEFAKNARKESLLSCRLEHSVLGLLEDSENIGSIFKIKGSSCQSVVTSCRVSVMHYIQF